MIARDTRAEALKPLRDLILTGNLMAMKIGQEPTNLANTWDEMVERLRGSGILERFEVMASNAPKKKPEEVSRP